MIILFARGSRRSVIGNFIIWILTSQDFLSWSCTPLPRSAHGINQRIFIRFTDSNLKSPSWLAKGNNGLKTVVFLFFFKMAMKLLSIQFWFIIIKDGTREDQIGTCHKKCKLLRGTFLSLRNSKYSHRCL